MLICSDVKNFILVGDIFDFLLGIAGSYFDKKFKVIAKLLKQLSQSGTRVVFLEGNHEFKISELKWQGVEYVDEGSLRLDEYGLVVSHGDMIKEDRKYFLSGDLLDRPSLLNLLD